MSIKKKIFYWKFDDTLLFKVDCAIWYLFEKGEKSLYLKIQEASS